MNSVMHKAGMKSLSEDPAGIPTPQDTNVAVSPHRLSLDEADWAEELAPISRRRNALERRMRQFVRFVLKLLSNSVLSPKTDSKTCQFLAMMARKSGQNIKPGAFRWTGL